jgi:hypothetical protein
LRGWWIDVQDFCGFVVGAMEWGMGEMEREVIGQYRGHVRGAAQDRVARAWLAGLGERLRQNAGVILTEGRHANVRFSMPSERGPVDVVVKSFTCGGVVEPIRSAYRGTKAWRSWEAALHLHGNGVGTPEPLAWLERKEDGRVCESYYVARYLPDAVSFKDALIGLYREEPDGTKLMALLQVVADAIRQMHAAGFVHYDLGNQNILLRRAGSHTWHEVCFIDLNRGRIRDAISDRERGRDLSRIALPGDFLRVFREMYAGGVPARAFLDWEDFYRTGYAWHSRTRRWRHPLRDRRKRLRQDTREAYPEPKSIWIWDPLSRQPLVTMRRKDRKKQFSLRRHLQAVWSPLRLLPACRRPYRDFLAQAFARPQPFDGCVGVAVEWRADDAGRSLAALEALGPIPVLVRFYRHADEAALAGAIDLVKALREKGHPVSIGLLQDRAAVEQPVLWASFVESVLGAVGTIVELVEVGHAINRVKWGIWTFEEYRALMEPLVAWRKRLPMVRFGGPAMIDFEYAYIPAALDHLPPGMRFDVLSHHLYVDRRGAPENPQGKYALLEKLALARAIGKAHRKCGDGLIITEFNWPLAGTGIHSPVGAPYVSPGVRHNDPSVTEEEAAAYLIRYVLIAIGSGLAERVFWWSLVAHGFGLIDDLSPEWRERPAYLALKVFLAQTRGAALQQHRNIEIAGHTVLLYRFRTDERDFTIAIGKRNELVPFPLSGEVTVLDAFGQSQEIENHVISIGSLPVYIISA